MTDRIVKKSVKASSEYNPPNADTLDKLTYTGIQQVIDLIKIEQNTTAIQNNTDALSNKSDTGHGHSIADTTDLQTTLDGKSPTGHAHAYQQHLVSQNTGVALHASTDWNNYKETGFYMGNSLLNAPSGITGTHSWWYVIIIKHNDNYAIQMATDFYNIATCYRVLHNGTWLSWKRIV